MKYTLSPEAIAAYAAEHNVQLSFDSITFEYSDSQGLLQGCTGTKTISVELTAIEEYDHLLALSKLAQDEMDAKQLAQDLRGVQPSQLDGLTVPQQKAIIRKFKQNPDGSENLWYFFNRVQKYSDYAGLQWCGMFLGIEKDGHCHS